MSRSRPYTAHRCRSKEDDEPRGHVHDCIDAGNTTACGKSIPYDGTWYIDHWREVTCPKCLQKSSPR